MSAVKKSPAAAKKAGVQAKTNDQTKPKTPSKPRAKVTTTPKVKASAPKKKVAAHLPAKPVSEKLPATVMDTKLAIVGATADPQGDFEKGDRFRVPIWSVRLLKELATVALGQRTLGTSLLVHETQVAMLMLAIPAYIDRARHETNHGAAPYDGFRPDPQLHEAVCDGISKLLRQGLHDEASILNRALQRLQAIDETWNSKGFGNKRLLKAIALRIDLAVRGKTPTKQKLRVAIYGDDVAESQVSREFKRITGLRDLRRAKSGPKPESVRGGKRP